MTAEPGTRVLSTDGKAIDAAARCLSNGGLVAFPTETVYGLGADAGNGEAIARLYAAKGRPAFNPLIAHVASAVVYMASLPIIANVQFMTVMATKMPFVGRG